MKIVMSIKRIIFLTTIGMILQGCCEQILARQISEQELLNVVNLIYKDTNGKLGGDISLKITFNSLDHENEEGSISEVIGQCRYGLKPFFGNEIIISKRHWIRMDFFEQYLLVAHELKHCECYAQHNDEFLKDGCPSSYMYASTASNECMRKHKQRYLDEVKKGCK